MSGFDLTAAKALSEAEDEGAIIEIHAPDGEPMMHGPENDPKPVTMRVAGSYSSTYRRAEEAATKKRLQAARRTRSTDLDAAAARQWQIDVMAKCVLEWDGFYDDGKPVPCTYDNVRAVLTHAPWAREQVEAAMQDHEVFSGKR